MELPENVIRIKVSDGLGIRRGPNDKQINHTKLGNMLNVETKIGRTRRAWLDEHKRAIKRAKALRDGTLW